MVRNNVLSSIAELEFEVALYRKKILDLEDKITKKELQIAPLLELIENNVNQSSEARSNNLFLRLFMGKKQRSEEKEIEILRAKMKLSDLKDSQYSLRRDLLEAKNKYERAQHELKSTKNEVRGNLSQQKWKAQDTSYGNVKEQITKQEKVKEQSAKSGDVKVQSTKTVNVKNDVNGTSATEQAQVPPEKQEPPVPRRSSRRRRRTTTPKTEN